MQYIAIYDLDRTILKTPTFTAFLIFAGGQLGRSLWWRMPLWVGALIGYKLKLYGRKDMKQYGMKLFISRKISKETAAKLAQKFAQRVVPHDVLPGAAEAIAQDRAEGRQLVIATAAQEFYVDAIAHALKFDAVIGTKNQQDALSYQHLLHGENCYGDEKLKRVIKYLSEQKIERSDAHICFYSDHHTDAPLLDWADQGVIVNAGATLTAMAQARGWSCQDWR
jgi:phosphatidylglycerophosphatase C